MLWRPRCAMEAKARQACAVGPTGHPHHLLLRSGSITASETGCGIGGSGGGVHELLVFSTVGENDTLVCIMGCLIYSLEKMSERKRRIFFYIAFLLGGVLALCGFGGFATPHKGWAFIAVIAGIFVLITTGILWDTMTHPPCTTRGTVEAPTAPVADEDDPPPDYESVVRAGMDGKNISRSNSKWSLYAQTWCPSFNPNMGYGRTPTADAPDMLSDPPPSYPAGQVEGRQQQTDPSADIAQVHGQETRIQVNPD